MSQIISFVLKQSRKRKQANQLPSPRFSRSTFTPPPKPPSSTITHWARYPARAVWNYQIGGYQVAHKWLKDRKGRLLTFADLQHYSQVIAALECTMALQTEIDGAIDAAGGWPLV